MHTGGYPTAWSNSEKLYIHQNSRGLHNGLPFECFDVSLNSNWRRENLNELWNQRWKNNQQVKVDNTPFASWQNKPSYRQRLLTDSSRDEPIRPSQPTKRHSHIRLRHAYDTLHELFCNWFDTRVQFCVFHVLMKKLGTFPYQHADITFPIPKYCLYIFLDLW